MRVSMLQSAEIGGVVVGIRSKLLLLLLSYILGLVLLLLGAMEIGGCIVTAVLILFLFIK